MSDVERKEDLLLCCSVAVLRKHQADKSAFPGPITRCRVIRDHLDTRLLRRVLHHAAVLQCCRHNLGHVPIIAPCAHWRADQVTSAVLCLGLGL